LIEFTDLKVWQKARQLCVEAYRVSDLFPAKERFRLVDQVCRAAISVVNNIAEGFGRGGGKDSLYHLRVSRGSVVEVRGCAILAQDLKYVSQGDVLRLDALALETYKMLTALLRRAGGLT
jgi:four helix bundle protein